MNKDSTYKNSIDIIEEVQNKKFNIKNQEISDPTTRHDLGRHKA